VSSGANCVSICKSLQLDQGRGGAEFVDELFGGKVVRGPRGLRPFIWMG
jgi:hypothetical protein